MSNKIKCLHYTLPSYKISQKSLKMALVEAIGLLMEDGSIVLKPAFGSESAMYMMKFIPFDPHKVRIS